MYAKIALCVAFFASVAAAGATLPDTLDREATRVARPGQAVLLAVTSAGQRMVAVGERGLIVVSDDEGKAWRQVPVPVSVTLTAASFPTPRQGWVSGHRGVILATNDGGETWHVQLDGRKFSSLVLAQAEAAGDNDERAKRALAEARGMAHDGADKPFLDVSFVDAANGLAVGAYGLCASTTDGGRSWRSCMNELNNPKGAHLYAIARQGPLAIIAGEQGLLLHSENSGANFSASSPLPVSLFCVGIAGNGDILAGSLKGMAFVSTDHGLSFQPIEADSTGSFSGATRLHDGSLLLVNQFGQVLQYDADSRRLVTLRITPGAPLSALASSDSGTWIATSLRGVQIITPLAQGTR